MKLNELKQLNELSMFGDYGSAAMKQVGNKLRGGAEGQLSVQDRMAKDSFIRNFVGRAQTNLNSAIQSGLVDPRLKTPSAGPVASAPSSTASPTTPTAATGTTSAAPAATGATVPAATRAAPAATGTTRAAATRAAPAATGATVPAGETLDQKRERLQKAAQQNADKTGMPFSKLPANQAYVQADNIRKQKQAPAIANMPRESKYATLNRLLENIINVDEAEGDTKQSISTYLQNMFTQYLKMPLRDPKAKAQLKVLADQAQASYPRMQDALTKLANLGFSISYSQGDAPEVAAAGASQTPSMGSSFMSGLTGKTATAPTTAATRPRKGTVDQIKKMIPTLNQQDLSSIKQSIDAALSSQGNPSNVIRMGKKSSGNISATKQGGATPEEYAKLQQRKLQQRIAQATK